APRAATSVATSWVRRLVLISFQSRASRFAVFFERPFTSSILRRAVMAPSRDKRTSFARASWARPLTRPVHRSGADFPFAFFFGAVRLAAAAFGRAGALRRGAGLAASATAVGVV